MEDLIEQNNNEGSLVQQMEMCNCNQNQKVSYVCLKTEKECDQKKDQKLYCI